MSETTLLELYKYMAYAVAFLLVMIRVGGVHLIFLFFVKMLRLDFNNQNLKQVSDDFYDLKLFKFFTGIKARSLKDVEFIQCCINSGKLLPINFLFSGFFGYAGSKKPNKYDLTAYSLMALACLLLGVLTAMQSSEYRKDYAIYIFDDGSRYYISSDELINPDKNKEVDCKNISSLAGVERLHASETCLYLDKNNSKRTEAVLQGIERNNRDRLTFKTLSTVFLIILSILILGLGNFIFSSAQLRKLKLAEVKSIRGKR